MLFRPSRVELILYTRGINTVTIPLPLIRLINDFSTVTIVFDDSTYIFTQELEQIHLVAPLSHRLHPSGRAIAVNISTRSGLRN